MRLPIASLAAACAAIQHVIRTTVARLDFQRNHTYICLRFNDENRLDVVFQIAQPLYGEALHQRLDALLDEHRDETLFPEIYVVVFDAAGRYHEESIRLNVV